jgi:hypothetical protein
MRVFLKFLRDMIGKTKAGRVCLKWSKLVGSIWGGKHFLGRGEANRGWRGKAQAYFQPSSTLAKTEALVINGLQKEKNR